MKMVKFLLQIIMVMASVSCSELHNCHSEDPAIFIDAQTEQIREGKCLISDDEFQAMLSNPSCSDREIVITDGDSTTRTTLGEMNEFTELFGKVLTKWMNGTKAVQK